MTQDINLQGKSPTDHGAIDTESDLEDIGSDPGEQIDNKIQDSDEGDTFTRYFMCDRKIPSNKRSQIPQHKFTQNIDYTGLCSYEVHFTLRTKI